MAATLRGQVKWFDPDKGFGFILPEDHGSDVLLHENVLFDFGQSSVLEGSEVEFEVADTDRGRQVAVLLSIKAPDVDPISVLQDILPEGADVEAVLAAAELKPARVKWFDRAKGFGFVNVFGSSDDIFVHVEVMRAYGMASLDRGIALGVKYTDGPKGLVAIDLKQWEDAVSSD